MNFLRHAAQSLPPQHTQNTMYFVMLSFFLVNNIFTFYIKGALNFKCPNKWP